MNMRASLADERAGFPRWVPLGAVLLVLAYLPSLAAPFDFIDDGDLVYPAPAGTTPLGHAKLWWGRVVANVEHLGPFRPALWAHWHLQANLFDANPLAWRAWRLCWCALSAAMLLWLFRELGVPPLAALAAGAAAMWNPYRNEVWMSLTLSEGVAMPYALFALVAARKGARANRPLWWDAAGVACVLVALGCKNTFAAVVPAQVALRFWPEGVPLRDALRLHRRRALLFALPLLLPAAHFVYFQLHWRPGHYDAAHPSAAQLVRYLACLKGAAGLDFLGAGVTLAALAVWLKRPTSPTSLPAGRGECGSGEKEASPCSVLFSPLPAGRGVGGVGLRPALLLLIAGTAAYLPVSIISGRYAMPAVWGLDILFALLLAALLKLPASAPRKAAWAALGVGLVALLLVNVHRQERAANRSRMLWEVARHIEWAAPRGSTVAWVSGDPSRGGLGVEEGIHMQWHLANRGRADVRIALYDSGEQPLPRAELPPAEGEPLLRVAGESPGGTWEWGAGRSFSAVYGFGRGRYDCHVSRRVPPASFADAGGPPRPPPPTSP